MKISIKPSKVSTSFKTERIYPELEDLEVTPSGEEQIFKSEKYGYDTVTVKATEGIIEDLTNELTEQDNLLTEQETTIEDIIGALQNKSAGGSGNTEESEDFIGIKFSNFTHRENPKTADARSLPDGKSGGFGAYDYLFANNNKNGNGGFFSMLEDVYLPNIYKFGVGMFSNCTCLKNIYGDFSNVHTVAVNTFANCSSLTELPYMPNLTNLSNDFMTGCTGITSITLWKVVSYFQPNSLRGIPQVTELNIPQGWNVTLYAQYMPNLTDECVQNIIDNLADLTGSTAQTLQLHTDVKAKLTDTQIASITSKNWTLA